MLFEKQDSGLSQRLLLQFLALFGLAKWRVFDCQYSPFNYGTQTP